MSTKNTAVKTTDTGTEEAYDFNGEVVEVTDEEYLAAKMEVEAARDAGAVKQAEDAMGSAEDVLVEQTDSTEDVPVVQTVEPCCDGLSAADIERRDMELALEHNRMVSASGTGDTLLIHYTHPVAAEMNGYKTAGSAGLDLAVVCSNCETMRLSKGAVTKVRTGTHVAIPHGHCGMLVCRSSAADNGVTMLPSVSVIDSDYRGEIMLPLTSTRSSGTTVYNGERFVQMVIVPATVLPVYTLQHKQNLPTTERGEGGFGHTGK